MNMKRIIFYLFSFLSIPSSFLSAQEAFSIITRIVDSYPMLSPDGTTLAFGSNRTGTYQVYTCKLDGSKVAQLTDLPGDTGLPIWSPDGNKILFSSEIDHDSEIFIMNADGSGQRRLTYQPGDDSHAKFSPDGKRIIFNSARTSPDLSVPWTQQYLEIFTMNIDGSDIKQITDFKAISTYPSFSPNGKKIAFRRIEKEPGLNWSLDSMKLNSEVFVIDRDGSNPVNVSNHGAYDGWPFWLSDQALVFTSNRGGIKNKGQLYKVNIDGTGLTRITPTDDSFIQASLSFDGKQILAQRNWETATYEYGHIVSIPAQ
jgi:TolB protein